MITDLSGIIEKHIRYIYMYMWDSRVQRYLQQGFGLGCQAIWINNPILRWLWYWKWACMSWGYISSSASRYFVLRHPTNKDSVQNWLWTEFSSYSSVCGAWISNILPRKSRMSNASPIHPTPYIITRPDSEQPKCKGYQCQQKAKSTYASMFRKIQQQNPTKNADQHLVFIVHPPILTLAANTRNAPSKADVDAHACGATYLPPSAACSAPPIGLSNH